MKIILEPQESEKIFYDALCNALVQIESSYGIFLYYEEDDYDNTREEGDCFEDVLMKMLKNGNPITIKTNGYTQDYPITIQDVHTRVQNTPNVHLMDAILERGDVCTYDEILQTVFFNEVIFG